MVLPRCLGRAGRSRLLLLRIKLDDLILADVLLLPQILPLVEGRSVRIRGSRGGGGGGDRMHRLHTGAERMGRGGIGRSKHAWGQNQDNAFSSLKANSPLPTATSAWDAVGVCALGSSREGGMAAFCGVVSDAVPPGGA